MRRAARSSDLQRHSSLFVLRMDTNGVPYVGMVPMHLRVAIFCGTRWRGTARGGRRRIARAEHRRRPVSAAVFRHRTRRAQQRS